MLFFLIYILLFTDRKKKKKARMLWDLFLTIVRTSWVFLRSVLQTLLAWQGAPVDKKRKKIWMASPLCLL